MKLFLTPVCLLIGLSISLIPTIASAQYNGGFGSSSDNRDPFSRANGGDTSGLLTIINRVQLNSQTNPNYLKEQQEQLNLATENYRQRQMEALRARNQKSTSGTVLAPQ